LISLEIPRRIFKMKALRFLRALPLALTLLASPVLASQATIVGPIVGPHTMADVMGTINGAFLAIQGCNSGSSAPANGPGAAPLSYQLWCDTTTNPIVVKMYDGASWVIVGKLNTSSHIWTPEYQGTDTGTASIATTGTSGHTLGFLDGANTYSAVQSFNSSDLSLKGSGSGAGTLNAPAAASTFIWTLPAATDTLVGKATTDTLTNKTFDTAGAGNSLSINSLAATANTGTGSVVRATSPALVTPALGAATATTINGNAFTASSYTLAGVAAKTLTFNNSLTLAGTDGTTQTFQASDTIVGRATTDTLTNKTIAGASNTLTVLAASQLSGATPVANGGTAQTTAVAARQSSGLNVYGDAGTGYGNVGQTLANTDRFAYTTAAFTASRAWVLPAANVTAAPYTIKIADLAGGVTATNTLVITRAGTDTINGGGTTATISAANGGYECSSDGSSKWSCLSMGAASAGGVTSITAGTGLSGGTITTSGTIAVSLTTSTNSLGADVNLSSTSTYFDGPSMAQGTSGTWFVSGTVTLTDTVLSNHSCKLWDGTTIISSATGSAVAAGTVAITLSGFLTTPAANIRISCKDITSVNGKILFNSSGNSKDSTVTGIRIQ
jgi:hypothetical protein